MFLWIRLSRTDKKLNLNRFSSLQGTDFIEFYVGNAKQAAHFYKSAFGFQSLAYAGPETGIRDKASYAVRQNKATFVFTTPLRSNNKIAEHIYTHGDGVKALALRVDDALTHGRKLRRAGVQAA
jgi:4-hydroxyphenylpyruvate dioxygenase